MSNSLFHIHSLTFVFWGQHSGSQHRQLSLRHILVILTFQTKMIKKIKSFKKANWWRLFGSNYIFISSLYSNFHHLDNPKSWTADEFSIFKMTSECCPSSSSIFSKRRKIENIKQIWIHRIKICLNSDNDWLHFLLRCFICFHFLEVSPSSTIIKSQPIFITSFNYIIIFRQSNQKKYHHYIKILKRRVLFCSWSKTIQSWVFINL